MFECFAILGLVVIIMIFIIPLSLLISRFIPDDEEGSE